MVTFTTTPDPDLRDELNWFPTLPRHAWRNIEVRQAWAYREIMPVIPLIDAGLSPILQWVVIPAAAFSWALRPGPGRRNAFEDSLA